MVCLSAHTEKKYIWGMGFLRYLFGRRMGRTSWWMVGWYALFFAVMLYASVVEGDAWVPLVFGSLVLGMLVYGAWLNYKRDGDGG